jgi:hypothetical protein
VSGIALAPVNEALNFAEDEMGLHGTIDHAFASHPYADATDGRRLRRRRHPWRHSPIRWRNRLCVTQFIELGRNPALRVSRQTLASPVVWPGRPGPLRVFLGFEPIVVGRQPLGDAPGIPIAPIDVTSAGYEEAAIGLEELSCAEVYDLSSALELDWYEDIGICGEGEEEALLHSGATSLCGRIPVNPSGGLACFGEVVPTQAQVCQLTWELRGQAGSGRSKAPVPRSRQPGLFGHGAGTILVRKLIAQARCCRFP